MFIKVSVFGFDIAFEVNMSKEAYAKKLLKKYGRERVISKVIKGVKDKYNLGLKESMDIVRPLLAN